MFSCGNVQRRATLCFNTCLRVYLDSAFLVQCSIVFENVNNLACVWVCEAGKLRSVFAHVRCFYIDAQKVPETRARFVLQGIVTDVSSKETKKIKKHLATFE